MTWKAVDYLILINILLGFCRLDKFVPEFGMGNINQGQHPLPDALAMQIGRAVFGNYIVYITSCSYHTGTFS